ncbi:antibiotic biosynthesis monooxygenase family protein [Chachezhania antarctica]|uniref:antibiotic biosynthesis monooxygenase family protein n=1 Tax=Chachezhania antarctica TaxID=2340860 RepID=UPI000EB46BA3|nr:antibiotic biosynthesis monooxygenase [Chachezhania antarctica]|tara:strand:- start:3146 stop:3472 length:327 start_codon:yes stop_codon:yes gene_type:complete
MNFIAMNRFKVKSGKEAGFEEVWKTRQSRLKDVEGFQEFRLLKGPVNEDEGYTLYSSHTIWGSREDFVAWTKSEHFREAHKNAGNAETRDALMGPPQVEVFETVVHEV